MLSSIQVRDKPMIMKEFVCSDGEAYMNSNIANRHEMLLKISQIFPNIHFSNNRKLSGKKFFFSRQLALDCGVYTVTIRDRDDMYSMEYFFDGLYQHLGYPETFPVDATIEIYYEDIKGTVRKYAQWRPYKNEG